MSIRMALLAVSRDEIVVVGKHCRTAGAPPRRRRSGQEGCRLVTSHYAGVLLSVHAVWR